MKLALAIICSFLLAGTPLVVAQPAAKSACAGQVRSCCKGGVAMPCCQTKPSPDAQPSPAVPAPTGNQNQLSLLASSALIWTLPSNLVDSISSHSTPSSMTAGAPLYERDCARLI